MENIIEAHIIEERGTLRAILPGAKVYSVAGGPSRDTKPRPTPGIYPDDETTGYDWAPWGPNDRLPTDIREKIYAVPMAAQAVSRLNAMMYGNGIGYYRNSDLDEGTSIKRARIPIVEQFIRRNRIKTQWLPAQFLDYRFMMNCFSEFILNGRRDQITNIYHKQSEFCRLSIQNERSGKIDYLYYHPKFGSPEDPSLKEIKSIRLFQWEQEEEFLRKLNGYKFAWHSRMITPGSTYYARPFWIGLFQKDGWIDVSRNVPKIISSMMHNQIVLKYHILIPESYFEIRHRDWHSYPDAQRNLLIDQLIKKINTMLRGVDKAYASISTIFREDPITKNPMGQIEIVPVDDKLKKDAWVPSSEKADAQIVQGLGLHPSQVGLAGHGGKSLAGSGGSDQRESFNTGIALNTIEQEVILEPLNWIAHFNAQKNPDWDITFFMDHTPHTTTNNQEDGLAKKETNIQVE